VSESPFVISTRELQRAPGATREVQVSAVSEHDLGNAVIAVPAGRPIELDLRLEVLMDGVLVTGVARAEASGECVRCLQEVTADLAVDISEMFTYPGRSRDTGTEEDEDPLPEVIDETVDLESTVVDAVVTALPLRPLCSPSCPGLCPQCGIRLEDAEPGHAHESIDPRWAALEALAGGNSTTEAGDEETNDDRAGDGEGGADGGAGAGERR